VKSQAENFHEQRFKKQATYLLKTFIDIEIKSLGIFSVRRSFQVGEISKPPTNKVLCILENVYHNG